MKKKKFRNPEENPYIKSIRQVLKIQKELETHNIRYEFPDIKEWVVINWEPEEGTFDVYKLLYVTIQKRIADSKKENLFSMGNINKEYEIAWGKFFELIRKLSDKYGYIDLEKLVK